MMAVADYLPLYLAVGLLGLVVAASLGGRVSDWFTRIALRVFGSYVRGREQSYRWRPVGVSGRGSTLLRAAHMEMTYRVYAARTYLFAATVALAGGILGLYLVQVGLYVLAIPEATMRSLLPGQLAEVASFLGVPQLGARQLLLVFLGSNATLGLLAGLATYQVRWWWPGYVARRRATRIEQSMQRTIAFMYALSRGGMEVPKILRLLADNEDVYGESATEVAVAVREMELFGATIVDALDNIAERTPSDEFGEFVENFQSVLRSGQSIPRFLDDQYQRQKEEARSRQDQYLELLGTLAEAYVTLLVAGPLFFITVLVILGLVIGGTAPLLRLVIYGGVPLATAGFAVYLSGVTPKMGVDRDSEEVTPEVTEFTDIRRAEERGAASTDGGVAGAGDAPPDSRANAVRLATHRRLQWVGEYLFSPLARILERPVRILYVTVPLALLYAGNGLYYALAADPGTYYAFGVPVLTVLEDGLLLGRRGLDVFAAWHPLDVVDDVLVHAALFVLGTYAAVQRVYRRRQRAIEAVVPDFLDRLASINEAGVPVVASIERIVETNLGALDEEIQRTWADIQWGARVEYALRRFDERVGSPMVSRSVALINNAISASGDLAPILRIAADEAESSERLSRQRRQEIFTYVVVVYVAFLVFLVIGVTLDVIFIPSIPSGDELNIAPPASNATAGATPAIPDIGIRQVTEETKRRFETLIFHAIFVQGICSGFIAGQMGGERLAAGAKHATLMLAVAYLASLLFAGP